ncbi:death domain-containing immune deficiency protein [Haematobia irritans]|uniref:death domain-containing immune deficiency protein n=1 Tax=Haematobia irritans TaxID=7368 RepID=UPI003F4F4562
MCQSPLLRSRTHLYQQRYFVRSNIDRDIIFCNIAMDFLKRLFPNHSGKSQQVPNGYTEKDAAPVAPDDSTIGVVRSIPGHQQVNETALVQSHQNTDIQNTLNINNANQQICMQISNVNSLHLGSVYNINNNRSSNCKPNKIGKEKKFNKKTTTIDVMMNSFAEPNHRMLDTVSTHLGGGWKQVMRVLGFSEGQISQSELDNQVHGTKEIIYQLLLDWVSNADDEIRTLGYLTKVLWNCGQHECVYRMKSTWKQEMESNKC